jgi:phage shock protein C
MAKRLYRTENNRVIAGVCGGVAEYFDWDPSFVRIIFAFIFLIGGCGLLLYLIMWLVVPPKSKVI